MLLPENMAQASLCPTGGTCLPSFLIANRFRVGEQQRGNSAGTPLCPASSPASPRFLSLPPYQHRQLHFYRQRDSRTIRGSAIPPKKGKCCVKLRTAGRWAIIRGLARGLPGGGGRGLIAGVRSLLPGRRTLSLRGALALCALSGALLALCFPPVGLWPLAWVALVPWLAALWLAGRWGALLGSWVGGFLFFGCLLYWLNLFGASVWFLACFVLSVSLVVWGAAVRWTGRLTPGARIAAAAALWCGVEWARGLGQFGFTWGWLGYSQSPAEFVLPVARAAGTLGISFLVVLVNAALTDLLVGAGEGPSRVRRLVRGAVVAGVVALCLLGAGRWAARQGGPRGVGVRVAVIQGSAHGPLRSEEVNVPLTREQVRRTMETYETLTERAAEGRPALIVWPESVLVGAPEEDPMVAEWVARAAGGANAWLVAGGPYHDEAGSIYNSAYLYAPTGNLVARYDKVQLVPFGEYVPWREWLPWVERYHVREVDFAAAPVHRLLQAGTMTLGPMICFESSFPQIGWHLVRRGAQVLVVITNDAWFGHTAAAAQHRQIAVLRAVETNRWVVRGASTGISSIIRPDGKIVAEAGLYESDVLSAEIRLAAAEPGERLTAPLFCWAIFYLAIALAIAPAAVPAGGRRDRAARRRGGPRPPARAAPR